MKVSKILKAEIMTGIQSHSQLAGYLCSLNERSNGSFAILSIL